MAAALPGLSTGIKCRTPKRQHKHSGSLPIEPSGTYDDFQGMSTHKNKAPFLCDLRCRLYAVCTLQGFLCLPQCL